MSFVSLERPTPAAWMSVTREIEPSWSTPYRVVQTACFKALPSAFDEN